MSLKYSNFILNGSEFMKSKLLAAMFSMALAHSSAHAINAKHAKQLERSGCTQVSEVQGCDITKTKAENTKAGRPFSKLPASRSPKTGRPRG